MSIEPLKLGCNKQFTIEFMDQNKKVRLRATGHRKGAVTTTTLEYSKLDYLIVKKKLQAFQTEANIKKKLSLLADAMNMGSESGELTGLVFLLNILWYYPWEEGGV